MKRRILMEKTEEQIRTFFLEDNDIVEIHCAPCDTDISRVPALGDIYIGRVKNIVQNIGAAFVEIAPGINCYLDMKDMKTAIFTRKNGKKPLAVGDELVVQISKEAVKSKAPTVTVSLSFTGRFAVLTHGNTRIGVSSKFSKKQKEEYREKLREWQNDQFGLIVRTNAREIPFSDVLKELNALHQEYETLVRTAPMRVCYSCLKSAPPSYISDLKNVYMDGMEEIIVNDRGLYASIQSYFEKEIPDKTGLLRLYDDPALPLSSLYGTEKALERALRERAWIKNGGYLIIQPTEALTVIDVNSGKNISRDKNEEGVLRINLEAAREAARQIRLRNLSGIIIIDFINMESPEHISTLIREFRSLLSKDPIQTTLVDMTPLNLVEVTRKKVHKPLYEQVKGGRYTSHE